MTECWHTPEVIHEMNKNYPVYLELMNQTEHISALKNQINYILAALPWQKLAYGFKTKVIDLGCGTAQISKLFDREQWEYTGADLPQIIEGCAKLWHPEHNYVAADLTKANVFDNEIELRMYDVILMNAFIDVMDDPIVVLDRVLSKAKGYVILHRQEFVLLSPTIVTQNDSYNAKTYHSKINMKEFLELLKKHNFEHSSVLSCGFNNWENGGTSIILIKK